MAITQLEEPMYRILTAQQQNIGRITPGLVVDGTTSSGDQVKLWSKTPNLIRLYDTPARIVHANAISNWETIITLNPISDTEAGKMANRDDRVFTYSVQFLVRLTTSEQEEDARQAVSGGIKAQNFLSVKAHRLVYDWHHIFHDDLHLMQSPGCTLIDFASYNMQWDPGVEYPEALFIAQVTGERSGW